MLPKISQILRQFEQKIKNIYQDNLSELILFGSQARGDAKQDSDIDVLIVLKETVKDEQKHQQVINLISDLCLEYELLISCVYVSKSQFNIEKSPLLINIHKEGIRL
ncbi:MAG TPA: nucleotidyltransferase domain-containing protein [Allocoleopsis sp.]